MAEESVEKTYFGITTTRSFEMAACVTFRRATANWIALANVLEQRCSETRLGKRWGTANRSLSAARLNAKVLLTPERTGQSGVKAGGLPSNRRPRIFP